SRAGPRGLRMVTGRRHALAEGEEDEEGAPRRVRSRLRSDAEALASDDDLESEAGQKQLALEAHLYRHVERFLPEEVRVFGDKHRLVQARLGAFHWLAERPTRRELQAFFEDEDRQRDQLLAQLQAAAAAPADALRSLPREGHPAVLHAAQMLERNRF